MVGVAAVAQLPIHYLLRHHHVCNDRGDNRRHVRNGRGDNRRHVGNGHDDNDDNDDGSDHDGNGDPVP